MLLNLSDWEKWKRWPVLSVGSHVTVDGQLALSLWKAVLQYINILNVSSL